MATLRAFRAFDMRSIVREDGDGAADFAIRLDPDADLGGADLIL